jgi:hypothetical protein
MSNPESQAQPVSPSMQMRQILWPGAMAVQAIHVAAKLGLADLVVSGPKSSNELADATDTHGPSMARLLRALTSLGIFAGGHAGPLSTNRVGRHARKRSSGIDSTVGHDAGHSFCLKTIRRTRRDGSNRATVVRSPARRGILRIPGRVSARRWCLQRRNEFLARLPGRHRRRLCLLSCSRTTSYTEIDRTSTLGTWARWASPCRQAA